MKTFKSGKLEGKKELKFKIAVLFTSVSMDSASSNRIP